jgi:hypothetical protein
MSAISEYVRLQPGELAELRRRLGADPHAANEYAGELRDKRGIDTDKASETLQHLLAEAGAPVDVVGGGEPITDEVWGYDRPRLLSVAQVAEAAAFLAGTPFAALARHHDPADRWDEGYLEENYDLLVGHFRDAAAGHEPILLWQD